MNNFREEKTTMYHEEKETLFLSRTWTMGILIAIMALATFLAFFHIGKLSFWSDELSTILFTKNSLFGMFGMIWPQEMNMSLYYLIINLWMHLTSVQWEGSLRSVSALFYIFEILAVFFLGRTIVTEKQTGNIIGLISAFLIAINAYAVQYANDLRSYSLIILLATLATFFLVRALQTSNKKYWTRFVITSVAAMYTHYFVGFLFAIQGIYIFFALRKKQNELAIKKLISSFITIGVCIIPLIIAVLLSGTTNIGWISKPTFTDMSQFVTNVAGGQGYTLLVLTLIAFCAGIAALKYNKEGTVERSNGVLFVSSAILPPAIVLLVSLTFKPLFVARYFVYILPFISIISALGIVKLLQRKDIVLKIAGTLLLVLITIFSTIGLTKYFRYYQNEDWRGVSGFVLSECGTADDLRLYYPTWTAKLSFYYHPEVEPQNAALEKNLDKAGAPLQASDVSGYKDACLIVLSSSATPNLSAIQNTLSGVFPKSEETKFPGALTVYVYRK